MSQNQTPATLIGFDGIPFSVLIQGREDVYPGWHFPAAIVTRQIPGSYRSIVQNMGGGPATLTLRLEFATTEAFEAFHARLGTEGNLTLLAGFGKARGYRWQELGRVYDRLDHVLVADIRDEDHAIDGSVECTVTFQRAMNPVTGLAVT